MAAVPDEIKTKHMRKTNQEILRLLQPLRDRLTCIVLATIQIDNREELHGDEVAVTSAGVSVC
jgi:hypothetical protein